MLTPFKGKQGSEVDNQALKRLVDHLIKGGVHGLMPLGTSGEFALLNRRERKQVVSAVVKAANHKLPVVAGVSMPGTREASNLAKDAEEAGTDAIISTGPYYFKTSSEGLLVHFQSLLDQVELPLMIYNIPSWTGYNIPPDVVKKLSNENPGRVIGVKFTTNDLGEFLEYVRILGSRMSIMIGADSLILPALDLGAAGAVVGSANVFPEVTSEIYEKYMKGEFDSAKLLQRRLQPLAEAMNLGTFPSALKVAMKLIHVDCGPVRLPLLDLNSNEKRRVKSSISWKLVDLK
jgi:4-hydroxy-tetrahydrodipicolinate synthase